ncbi:FAD-binding protein, partial [Bilophila wadsworthia]|uniref:FAD-binding protein n=1 Tax=Bilophila wadsworthia TaxID=35833 RepID=UPI003AB1C854
MKEQGYQYTTDLLVIGCGFSGMWAAMRARDFLGDVLVVDKGPRDWGGLGGLSGGDMIVKQPDMKLDDLLDDLVYYYDGLADQKLLGQILTQSYDRFMDFENLGHKFVRNDKGELCFIPQRALDYMRYYYYHPYGMGGIEKARLTNVARDLAQFSARFGRPLTYKLSKLAHYMQSPEKNFSGPLYLCFGF